MKSVDFCTFSKVNEKRNAITVYKSRTEMQRNFTTVQSETELPLGSALSTTMVRDIRSD